MIPLLHGGHGGSGGEEGDEDGAAGHDDVVHLALGQDIKPVPHGLLRHPHPHVPHADDLLLPSSGHLLALVHLVLGVGPVHLLDLHVAEDDLVARHEHPPGQGGVAVTLELELEPPPGDELDVGDALHQLGHLLRGVGLGDPGPERRHGLDAELPIVHARGDCQGVAGADVVVVKLHDCRLGVLHAAVAGVSIGAVSAAELYHEPQLVQLPHRLEHWDQLIFETVTRNPVAINLVKGGDSFGLIL